MLTKPGWLLAVGCSAFMFLTAAANAEGFSTKDLGSISTEKACINRARQVYNSYKREVRAGKIATGNWSAALFDIRNNAHDAIIICSYGPKNKTRASLVVYSSWSNKKMRNAIAKRIKQIWKGKMARHLQGENTR